MSTETCKGLHAYKVILHFESEFQEQNAAIFYHFFHIRIYLSFNIIIISSMAIPSDDHFFPYKVSMCNSSWLLQFEVEKFEHHYEMTLRGSSGPIWLRFLQFDGGGGDQITIMN